MRDKALIAKFKNGTKVTDKLTGVRGVVDYVDKNGMVRVKTDFNADLITASENLEVCG